MPLSPQHMPTRLLVTYIARFSWRFLVLISGLGLAYSVHFAIPGWIPVALAATSFFLWIGLMYVWWGDFRTSHDFYTKHPVSQTASPAFLSSLLGLWWKVLLYGAPLCIFAFLLDIRAGFVMTGVILFIGAAGTFFCSASYSSAINTMAEENDTYVPPPGRSPPYTASTP